MDMKQWAVSMGLGAAVGAITVSLLPRQSSAKHLVDKAAGTVENAARNLTEKLTGDM